LAPICQHLYEMGGGWGPAPPLIKIGDWVGMKPLKAGQARCFIVI